MRDSEESCVSKGIESHVERIVLRRADDDVVDEVDPDDLCGLPQLAGELDVGGTRRRIPARMVVLCVAPSYVE